MSLLKLIKFLNVVFMIITQLKLGNTRNPDALVLWSQVNRFLSMLPFIWDNSLTVHLKMLLMYQYVQSFSVKF